MDIEIKIFDSIYDIASCDWNQLIDPNFPFLGYEFLCALEDSQSIGVSSGWEPAYITAWQGDILEGAILLYVKMHSYGEYIFDWQWAQAYAEYGVEYYPKLTSAIPFTPATCNKVLLRNKNNKDLAMGLIQETVDCLEDCQGSSIHYLYIHEDEQKLFEACDFVVRHSFQYHWFNQGYRDFSDFLCHLKRKRRGEILRERRNVSDAVSIEVLTGEAIKEEHAEAMVHFYHDTIAKMGAIPYLTPEFFKQVFQTMKENIVLNMAKKNDQWIAGALNFTKGKGLYGRYWGCIEDIQYLHFELCYYQTIEYAIKNNFEYFEAGAQGEHKISRGFKPSLTYSAHWIQNEGFRHAINDFIVLEKKTIAQVMKKMALHNPYKSCI